MVFHMVFKREHFRKFEKRNEFDAEFGRCDFSLGQSNQGGTGREDGWTGLGLHISLCYRTISDLFSMLFSCSPIPVSECCSRSLSQSFNWHSSCNRRGFHFEASSDSDFRPCPSVHTV